MNLTLPPLPERTQHDYLSDEALISRMIEFFAGPHTLDAASDRELLAFAVPPVFGGLRISPDRQQWVHQAVYQRDQWLGLVLQGHYRVCWAVLGLGTYTQCNHFLPVLASGKRVGYNQKEGIGFSRSESYGDEYLLSCRGRFVAYFDPQITFHSRQPTAADMSAIIRPGFVLFDILERLTDKHSTFVHWLVPTEMLTRIHAERKHRIEFTIDNQTVSSQYRLG